MDTVTDRTLHMGRARRAATALALRLAGALAVGVLAACSSGSGNGVSIGSGSSSNDTVSPDYPIAYIKRTLPDPADPEAEPLEDDLRVQRVWNGPADVWLRERSAPSALEKNITERITNGEWDVRDLDASADGRKLVFSMRAPLLENADESEQPKWEIYEYDVASDTLRRVIQSDIVASEGHDVAPHYLPDGRIVFSSSRQRGSKAILIDEGKSQYSAGIQGNRNLPGFVLHVMNPDGTGIRQISYNLNHDLDPVVMNNGQLLFSRWDAAAGTGMHLYTINPDGSFLQLLYGRNSHLTGTNNTAVQFVQARPRPDGRVVALMRPFQDTEFGGDAVLIDVQNYVENTQPVATNAGGTGPAQSRLVVNDVRTIPGPSPGGRYSSVFPLWDGTNRLLVSWSQCRLVQDTRYVPCTSDALAQPNAQVAPPIYGVFIYDPARNTQLPVVAPTEGVMYTEAVALQPRTPAPPALRDAVAGVDFAASLAAEGVGILNIKSVYDFDGVDASTAGIPVLRDPSRTAATQRPARFLRIEKPVGLPDDEVLEDLPNYAFGVSGVGMRELLGYVPIEPDGSVRVKVPANVALDISIVDGNGRRSPLWPARHRNWLQVRAGEVVTCIGCHRQQAGPNGEPSRSHGRSGLFTAVNAGAPTGGQPFPATTLRIADNTGVLVPTAVQPDLGETMAEYRARAQLTCTAQPCAMTPSVNVIFDDVWSVTPGGPGNESIAWLYSQLATPPPTDCDARWESRCRVVIHYPRHVAPLWVRNRQVLADENDPTSVIADNTCTACHSPTDANNQRRVPAGQLDLRNEPSDDDQLVYTSFRELLFPDNEQELIMGALRDRLVPGPIDPVSGLPTQVPVVVQPSMSGAGANASPRFFSIFAPGGSHAGRLDAAELRLIAEWLDLGGQYYNDPFAIPVN